MVGDGSRRYLVLFFVLIVRDRILFVYVCDIEIMIDCSFIGECWVVLIGCCIVIVSWVLFAIG